jgi:hypothetical protein
MSIILKSSSKRAEGFFVVFFREDLPEKTPPAEQPISYLWAYLGLFFANPAESRQEPLL